MTTDSLSLPAPAENIEAAKAHLDDYGVCIVADVLDSEVLATARAAIYRAAESDRESHLTLNDFPLDPDEINVRVWNLLTRDAVFAKLAEHPVAMELVNHILGWPTLLSNISGNITRPSGSQGKLHVDQLFVPQPWPELPQGLIVAWCLDDFTAENGATQVIPGSHKWNRMPSLKDANIEMLSAEASAGSIIAFESRTWHRTGGNSTQDTQRAAVLPFYTKPIYRTQENWFLTLDETFIASASPTLLTLLGYQTQGLGLVHGRSPR